MNPTQTRPRAPTQIVRNFIALICAVLILIAGTVSWAMQTQQAPATAGSQDAKLSNDQLDSLVSPIALYPDPLLSQTLVASTYPLEIVQLNQWLEKNKNLKGKAVTDAVEKQNWDPSVQAMAAFPTVVKNLAENISWTDNLGNAFLAQQSEVMDAVQRMRKKAVDKGALQSSEQQKVETKTVENKTVIIVEPASPEVVYVPSYAPVGGMGRALLSVPSDGISMVRPDRRKCCLRLARALQLGPRGATAAGVGIATGAAITTLISTGNNTFVNNYNRGNGGNRYGGANNAWRHNPQHRGGAPYGNRATAQQYGGAARGDNMSQRQSAARQNAGAGKKASATDSLALTNRASIRTEREPGSGGYRVGNRPNIERQYGLQKQQRFFRRLQWRCGSSQQFTGLFQFPGSRGGGGPWRRGKA